MLKYILTHQSIWLESRMRLFKTLQQRLNLTKKRYAILLLLIFVVVYIASMIYHTVKPLPQGLNYRSEPYAISHQDVQFLADYTFSNSENVLQTEQQIFSQMLTMIAQAKRVIVLDMFLLNGEQGQLQQQNLMPMNERLVEALLQKKREYPDIAIHILTDPINSLYGSILPAHYTKLRNAGIELTETNLSALRASNPIWSGFWYMCCQSLNSSANNGWIPSPFNDNKMTLTSYFQLFNLRANHRKVLISDNEDTWQTLITSANIHDASSLNANVAMLIKGNFAQETLKAENAVAMMSGVGLPLLVLAQQQVENADTQIQLLTEQAIYDKALQMINHTQANDEIKLLMFYLSERNIIQALKNAQARGVKVQVLLDPSLNAFGRQKNGIPNQPVAYELNQAGIAVRWCKTAQEQCHSKMLIVNSASESEILQGSANFTARNLKNYNLESDVWLKSSKERDFIVQANQYFDDVWHNKQHQMSLDYTAYAESSTLKYWQYRFMEWSGLSSF